MNKKGIVSKRLHWTGWIVVVLACVTGGWMAFDGTRALVSGDYVTASGGAYAGQLGPWSNAVEAVGLDPHSATVKSVIMLYGLVTIVLAAGFARGWPWGWWGMFTVAILGLWYLPVGTATGLVTLVLLLLPGLRSGQRSPSVSARL